MGTAGAYEEICLVLRNAMVWRGRHARGREARGAHRHPTRLSGPVAGHLRLRQDQRDQPRRAARGPAAEAAADTAESRTSRGIAKPGRPATMSRLSKERQRRERLYRIALADAKAHVEADAIPAATLRDILQHEAAQPLRGGNAEMSHTSLFGDSHLQKELF